MARSLAYRNALLQLIFNAVTFAGMARDDAAGNTFLYLALHTADPGVGGDQSVSEISYTGYSRIAVPRNSTGFYVNNNSVFLMSAQYFGQMTAGVGGLATHWSIGLLSSGAGLILHAAPITTPSVGISIVNGVRPRLTAFNINEN
jgi:hypothetical protein